MLWGERSILGRYCEKICINLITPWKKIELSITLSEKQERHLRCLKACHNAQKRILVSPYWSIQHKYIGTFYNLFLATTLYVSPFAYNVLSIFFLVLSSRQFLFFKRYRLLCCSLVFTKSCFHFKLRNETENWSRRDGRKAIIKLIMLVCSCFSRRTWQRKMSICHGVCFACKYFKKRNKWSFMKHRPTRTLCSYYIMTSHLHNYNITQININIFKFEQGSPIIFQFLKIIQASVNNKYF